MAGLKMKWIDDSTGNPVIGAFARPAYRVWGKWAFEKNQKWLNFLNTASPARLGFMASTLRTHFVGSQPDGAANPSPRIIILYDAGPASLTDAAIAAYHAKHEMTVHEDGDTYTQMMFKGNPATMSFDYIKEMVADENENLNQNQIDNRSHRLFTMMLITKCR